MAAGGEGNVRLLGMWPSPFVMRVRFALGLKKVPYEFVEECVFNKSELLLKSNPVYKKIPVLLHGDDRSICESMIIVEYVDDVWKSEGAPALVPSDPYTKAMARFWAAYIDDKWFPNLRGLGVAKSPEETAAAMEQVFVGLGLLEAVLSKGGKPFFSGETVGYLDIALGGYLPWIKATEKLSGINFLDESKVPLLVAWVERFLANEAVKEVVPETEKFVAFFKMMKEKMAASSAAK